MNIKYGISILLLSSVILLSGLAKADTRQVQTNNLKILSNRTSSNYSIQVNGSNARLCVNGTCRSYFNCPALTVLALPQNSLRMTIPNLESAKVFCDSRIKPKDFHNSELRYPSTIVQFNKGGTNTTTIYRSQTSNGKGGITQVYNQQSTIISH